jgi:RNA polymerase primary sigma factor
MAEIRNHARLTREEEERLYEKYSDDRPELAGRLARSNLGFVVRIAMEYRGMGLPLEDLLAEGNLGLLEAANRFDGSRGTRFSTYAVWWIRKSILNALAHMGDMIRLPHDQIRKVRQIRHAEGELHRVLGRKPSREEISGHLLKSTEEVEDTLRRRATVSSLDQPVGEREDGSLHQFIRDRSCRCPEERILKLESRRLVSEALADLPENERYVIQRRYGLLGGPGATLREIAEGMGLSRERVRQIEREGTDRLRKRILAMRWNGGRRAGT